MTDSVPPYVLRQIQRIHGWSLNEWISFNWPRIPNGFTLLLMVIITSSIFNRLIFNTYDDIVEQGVNVLLDTLISDAILFYWFTSKRCMVAVKKFKQGKDWKIIRPEEVSFSS